MAGRGALAASPLNVANLITGFRIALVPLLIFLLTGESRASSLLAGLVFFIACLSDFFDGYLARRHGIGTDVGKFLDPLADKLLVVSALIMLAAMEEPRVPAWLVAAIAVRELAVTGLRIVALQRGVVIEADQLGKYKTVYQMFALQGLLLHYPFAGVDFQSAGTCFLWVSALLGFWSAAVYYLRVMRGGAVPA